MKIVLGSDHGGFQLKEEIKNYLQSKDYKVIDVGTNSEDSVDYPEYAKAAADKVMNGEATKGIVICGTGIGISISANKVKGIRAALCHNVYTAIMARKHNNANILALGGRVLAKEEAYPIVDAWLTTDFEGDRHQRRIDKISAIENNA